MYLSIYLSIYLSVCLSIYLSVCKLENEAILRDVFIFPSWQHQKGSNSARLPSFLGLTNVKKTNNSARLLQFLNLTTSKTKQFCETSSFFTLDSIKNEVVLRGFLQKWKVACSADGLVPMRFAIFPVHLSKVLRMPRKSARSYEVLCLSREIISANLKIWCSKSQPLSGNQRPERLTAPMKMSLVLRLPRKMHLCRSSSSVPRLPSFLAMLQNPHVFAHFWEGAQSLAPATRKELWTSTSGPYVVCFVHFDFRATTACSFSTSQLLKVLRSWSVLLHFDFEMCFGPERRALFDISTSKSGPTLVCFVYFDIFWLGNVLRATTACTFSSLIWPDGSAPAALASLLFDPPEPQNIGKTQCFATFLPFRASASSFWLFLFSDLLSSTLLFSLPLPISAFHLSILSEIWLLNFLRLWIQRYAEYIASDGFRVSWSAIGPSSTQAACQRHSACFSSSWLHHWFSK